MTATAQKTLAFAPATDREELEKSYQWTDTAFRFRIEKIAAVAGMQSLEVFALWRGYALECDKWNQSAVLGEFIGWHRRELVEAIM